MRSPLHAPRENGQVIVLILIIVAILGGGLWMLKANSDMRAQEGRAFAEEGARRIVLQQDTRFLDRNFSPDAQVRYPQSFRLRMLDYIREAGPPPPQFELTGDVKFTNHFFDPNGVFLAKFSYPAGPAYLELHISHPGVMWVVDAVNWTWQPVAPPPTPTPTPTLAPATPSPSSTPTSTAKPHKSKP